MKKAGTRVVGWSPDFFLVWRLGASTHPNSPHLASAVGGHHPPLTAPRHPHLNPHRGGCPRRGLFRVLGNPKVFALLFAENASCELLWAPRGIVAILWSVWGHLWRLEGAILHSTHPDTPISEHTAEDALEGLYFAF